MDEVGWYVVSRPSAANRNNIRGQIAEGLLTAYSIGGRRLANGRIEINDVSYVSRPANKLAYHRIIKSDDDVHQRARNARSFEELARINKGGSTNKHQRTFAKSDDDDIHQKIRNAKSFEEAVRIIKSYVPTKRTAYSTPNLDSIRERMKNAKSREEGFRIIEKYRKSCVPMPANRLTVNDDIHQKIRDAESFEEAARIIERYRRRAAK